MTVVVHIGANAPQRYNHARYTRELWRNLVVGLGVVYVRQTKSGGKGNPETVKNDQTNRKGIILQQ